MHERYGLTAVLLSTWRSERRLELHHDADGRLLVPAAWALPPPIAALPSAAPAPATAVGSAAP